MPHRTIPLILALLFAGCAAPSNTGDPSSEGAAGPAAGARSTNAERRSSTGDESAPRWIPVAAEASAPLAPGSAPVTTSVAETASSSDPAAADATVSDALKSAQQDSASSASMPASRPAPALALWNDPDFQRRFAESYIAETELEPRLTQGEREQMQKVLEFIAAERTDRALALLLKQSGPAASAVIDFTLANLHFQEERLTEAADAYYVAVEKYPKFRRAWRNLALIHVRAGDFREAAEAFTRVLELGGGDGITYGLLGFAYSNLENELAAETAYRFATLLEPSTLDWKMGLARSLFKQRRYADAASLCEALIAAQPDLADLWLLQANALIGLDQPLRAAENFELVERMGKATEESLNALGDIYMNAELFDLGVAAYLRALERFPDGGPARALRAARVLVARGELAETRELLTGIEAARGERLELTERKDLLKLRARLAVASGGGDEEARVLEEIVALDPLDGEALLLLGQHQGRQGDVEQAVFYFERAAGIAGFEADAKVRHAQLLVGESRFAEALPLLRRAQTLQPREHVQQYLEQVERIAQGR